MSFRVWAVALTLVWLGGAALGPSLVAETHASRPWIEWRPANCIPDACFCEAVGDGPIRQPSNAWSSLAFVGAAIVVLWRNALASGPFGGHAAYPVLFSSAVAFLGFGSAFYHSSLTFAGMLADVQGMQFVALFVVVFNLRARIPGGPTGAAGAFAALDLVSLAIQSTVPVVRRLLFAATISVAVWSELRLARRDRKLFGAALATFGAAFVIWVLDITRVVCDPASALQGHALWHGLGAIATVLVAEHFARNENGPNV